jgi:hypothetical protein
VLFAGTSADVFGECGWRCSKSFFMRIPCILPTASPRSPRFPASSNRFRCGGLPAHPTVSTDWMHSPPLAAYFCPFQMLLSMAHNHFAHISKTGGEFRGQCRIINIGDMTRVRSAKGLVCRTSDHQAHRTHRSLDLKRLIWATSIRP